MFKLSMKKFALSALPLVLLAATTAHSQYSNTQDRGTQGRDDFYNGVRDGQAGGQYSQNPRHYYDQNGYDQYGYDRDGYNRYGYNPSGYNRNGQRQQQLSTRNPYDQNGYDRNGYDRNGYDRNGQRKAAGDRNGYNQNGYDRNGRDRNGRTQVETRDNRYGDRTYPSQTDEGGIGPGKGAMIGGAGGAILGAIFGGGLKGSIIGGAAGAGIGAVVGKEHQDTVRRRDGSYPPQ